MKYLELSYPLDFFRVHVIFMMEENMRWQANYKPISKQKNPSLQKWQRRYSLRSGGKKSLTSCVVWDC